MENKKKILIDTLLGKIEDIRQAVSPLQKLSKNIDGTDYVDVPFFQQLLEVLSAMAEVSSVVSATISNVLGLENMPSAKKTSKSKARAPFDEREFFNECFIEDGYLKMPRRQIDKDDYAKVKAKILDAGGEWIGGKTQGFKFRRSVEEALTELRSGNVVNRQQQFNFFATPAALADKLAATLGPISPSDRILEPSAGDGALIDAVHRIQPDVLVFCYELMPENREVLLRKRNVLLKGEDFMKDEISGVYDKIIANPPFAKNQDIDHTLKMYEALKPGGKLAVIVSPHWEFSSEKKCQDFRIFLEKAGAHIEHIPGGAFKESGTLLRTNIITLDKPLNV